MKSFSLTKNIIGAVFLKDGVIANADGSISKGFEVEPLSSGILEEAFEGPTADHAFAKVSELLTRLPNLFDGQILFSRHRSSDQSIPGFESKLYVFEKVKKAESYSHAEALLNELQLKPIPLTEPSWSALLSSYLGADVVSGIVPDLAWKADAVSVGSRVIRTLSLTELPQVTWKGCLQPIYESAQEFTISIRLSIPDRQKIKRQLETKRRVSHALSISSSLEVRNIESNSVLHSSEETLERILVGKETLFEASVGVILYGAEKETLEAARDFERVISGIGNAGLYLETIGTLPVFKSHIPGSKILPIRKLAILSENLAHLLPLYHDYSRVNDRSALSLRSRSGEVSHLNLFSADNLNFNAFICGASGSGKSFLMNAILSSLIQDEKNTRLCIFDIGGSYRKIVTASGGTSSTLTHDEGTALIATFLKSTPVSMGGFFQTFIETLCGSGSHITHSHKVAIDEILKELEGSHLSIRAFIESAQKRTERFYQDLAHWLKPHLKFDEIERRDDLIGFIDAKVGAFDFKGLDSDPTLQRTTILLLSELLWRDLVNGKYPRTLIVFDEVWRFFAQSKSFLEEMYRTLRKYKAGIVSITQNLADYGDEAFAKMIFTNSFTKLFLQNGATSEFLKNTFDLPETDILRALSVTSKKPHYSEFFALTASMSQVFRLYPTREFYELANTENISKPQEKSA